MSSEIVAYYNMLTLQSKMPGFCDGCTHCDALYLVHMPVAACTCTELTVLLAGFSKRGMGRNAGAIMALEYVMERKYQEAAKNIRKQSIIAFLDVENNLDVCMFSFSELIQANISLNYIL